MLRHFFSKTVPSVLFGLILVGLPTEAPAQPANRPPRPRLRIVRPRRRPPRLARLPHGHVRIVVGGVHYYHHRGIFYKKRPGGYVVVKAPVGARIKVLPPGYTTVHVRKVPYYYYYGTYYVHDSDKDEYVAVEAPEGAEEAEEGNLDKVTLIDGTTLEGVYVGGTESTMKFDVEGETREIEIAEIVSITFAPPSEEEPESEEE